MKSIIAVEIKQKSRNLGNMHKSGNTGRNLGNLQKSGKYGEIWSGNFRNSVRAMWSVVHGPSRNYLADQGCLATTSAGTVLTEYHW